MYEKYGTKNKKSKHMLTYKFIACLMTIVMLANVGSTSVIAAEDGVLQNEDGSQDASEIGESNESNESESSVPGNDETESGGETGDNKNEESGDGNPGSSEPEGDGTKDNEPEGDGTKGDEPESGDSTDNIPESDDTSECICTEPCIEGSPNESCPVCKDNYAACAKAESGELPECICDVLCTEENHNEECPVCSDNYENCALKENSEPAVCTCDVLCTADAVNTECPVCSDNYENCKPVVCICEVPCTEDAVNTECPVCNESYEKCKAVTEPMAIDLEEAAVGTEEELSAAVSAGVAEITLKNNIELTTTLTVPETANIILDGQGLSLGRKTGDDETFKGAMICLSNGSSLTLTGICVDGQIEGAEDHADAPTIIDSGRLTLGDGAVIKGNSNYGAGDGNNSYGGGIQVYGELTVTEKSQITQNYADKRGGGIYLAGKAVLNLNADVISENKVNDADGQGADLYAEDESTIYYDASINMERDSFCLCENVNLVRVGDAETHNDSNVEIYLGVLGNSGYSDKDIADIKAALEAMGYKVLTDMTEIDTTDLRDWYVYDHYDTNAWSLSGKDWESEYGGNPKRQKFDCTEKYYNYVGGPLSTVSTVKEPVYTIAEWLQKQDEYYVEGTYQSLTLAQFREHIYTREEDGYPKMTFVGYGQPAYVDFLYYDPESNGEKVVDFDVDSSNINTHTLAGSGFLVNTGVDESKNLHGYLVYYDYTEATTAAKSVSIYKIDGISAEALHNGTYDLKTAAIASLGTKVQTYPITSDWENEMSIQIRVTPTSIKVKQQPKSKVSDVDNMPTVLDYTMPDSGYSGFGPLVAYTSVGHTCMKASSFTYSNLRMYFTNPELEQEDLLNLLGNADFTQENTQKYFINLLGASGSKYNDKENAEFGQYREYLKMMQDEGIALITDQEAPFDNYLGDNLCDGLGSSVESLINAIIEYIEGKNTTYMKDKLEGSGGKLKAASPHQSVGNVWLESGGGQVRTTIGEDNLPVTIQCMDDIAYYYNEDASVRYDVIRPNKTIVLSLTEESPHSQPSFEVEKDKEKWPSGRYTVKQTIDGSSIHGYAYFTLKWNDEVEKPSSTPTPQRPRQIQQGEEIYDTYYYEQEDSYSASAQGESPEAPAGGRRTLIGTPAATVAAPEISDPDATNDISEPASKDSEPKTGAAFTVEVCVTISMIMALSYLFFYFADGKNVMTEEKMKAATEALLKWAKKGKKFRKYIALAAIFILSAYYHSIGKRSLGYDR